MMDPSTIRRMSQEAAAKSAAEGLTPFVYAEVSEIRDDSDRDALFPFPFLGDYVPEGWTLAEEHFADSSGLGRDDEPALSINQLFDLIESRMSDPDRPRTIGWGITEAGQFQVYVGEFHRD